MQIKRLPVDRREVHLKIASMNHDSHGRANGQRHAVNRAVRHADELDFKRSYFHLAPRNHFAQVRLFEQSVFFQTLVHQRQRKSRPIDGRVQVAQNVGQRPNVIFMPVRQQDSPQMLAVLL